MADSVPKQFLVTVAATVVAALVVDYIRGGINERKA